MFFFVDNKKAESYLYTSRGSSFKLFNKINVFKITVERHKLKNGISNLYKPLNNECSIHEDNNMFYDGY